MNFPASRRLLPAAILLLTACPAPTHAQETAVPAYRNDSLDPEARASDLLGRLTLDEKISLLRYTQPAINRLGIPAYTWWNEALHGVARNGYATVFPQAIAMAATWDPELISREGEAVSVEARVKYDHAVAGKGYTDIYEGLTFWSPNVNIFRDPRWGRGQETYGEDPFLTSRIGAAYIRGLQGDDPTYLRTAAAVKHFAVHSGPEHNRHSFDASVTNRDLYETYLRAFEYLVRRSGVEAVMCAYNRLDGQPCCADQFLLTDILRTRWGFRGHVVTDCWAISDMINGHGTYGNETEASAASLKAGVDISCGPELAAVANALNDGLIDTSDIDSAVFRLLRTRVRLGMFSRRDAHPFFHTDPTVLNSPGHDTLSRRVAAAGMVLLKNAGHILPLRSGILRLGVAGAIAEDTLVLLGNYNGVPLRPVTFLGGIREMLSGGSTLVFSEGYDKPWGNRAAARPPDDTGAARSVAAAGKALPDPAARTVSELSGIDIVIVFAGISAALEGEEGDTGEMTEVFYRGDRTTLTLPSAQRRLIRRLYEAGKKIILVVTSGGAISLTEEREMADAILMAWYPGQRGGSALASLLFGTENPSGRLPVTFYRTDGDLPPFEDYSMEGRTYRYFQGDPLYEFGYGLSYTTFRYDNLRTSRVILPSGDSLSFSLDVTNTGDRQGREVVQAYLKKPGEGGSIRDLCAFRKVLVRPGETVTVDLCVPPEEFRSYDPVMDEMTVREGFYLLEVGSSSQKILLQQRIRIISPDGE